MSFSKPNPLWSKSRAALEHVWHRAVLKGVKGPGWSTLRGVLSVARFGYEVGARSHAFLYASGMRRQIRGPIPLISVGNIALGGSGKTPFTCLLAEKLLPHRRVGIISRGYRSEAERLKEPLIASLGGGPLYSASVMGDEAYLLSSRLPDSICVVGRDRARALRMSAELGAQVAILDDGMQHHSIKPDLHIVLLSGALPDAAWQLFPKGALREPLSSLSRADLIVISSQDEARGRQLQERLKRYTSAPIAHVFVSVRGLFDKKGWVRESLEGQSVGLIAGIAQPERFEHLVESLGARVVAMLAPGDHQGVSQESLERFARKAYASGAQRLLCTEKDWVKLPLTSQSTLPLHYLQMDLSFRSGEEHFQELLRGAFL